MPKTSHTDVMPQLNATAFGIRGDGLTLNTRALQAAIDATAVHGGELLLPPGTYLTGALFLKSGMTLRLDGSEVFEARREGSVHDAEALGRDAGEEVRALAGARLVI